VVDVTRGNGTTKVRVSVRSGVLVITEVVVVEAATEDVEGAGAGVPDEVKQETTTADLVIMVVKVSKLGNALLVDADGCTETESRIFRGAQTRIE
jgi:hypothetical protein